MPVNVHICTDYSTVIVKVLVALVTSIAWCVLLTAVPSVDTKMMWASFLSAVTF